jgi:oxygen-independent coproporphyrinogen-3 oxidase
MGSRRWCHEPDIKAWAEALHSGKEAIAEAVDLSPDESLKEALIFGLRLVTGIKPSEFQNRFGVNVLERFGPSFRELESDGLIELGEDSVRIPRDKLLVSNKVFIKFV